MAYIHAWKAKQNHAWATASEPHVYRGSLNRHVAVDNAIILIAKPTSLKLIRNNRLYRILRFYCVVLWGLNCNFPVKDVWLFSIDYCFKGRH